MVPVFQPQGERREGERDERIQKEAFTRVYREMETTQRIRSTRKKSGKYGNEMKREGGEGES